MKAVRAAVLVASMVLAGCAQMPKPPPGYPANWAIVAPRVNFVLPPPSAIDKPVDIAQTVVSHYGSKSFAFDARIQVNPDELDFVALDGFGRRALTITWKGDTPVYTTAPWLPPMLRPANVLADFMICYWPDDALAAAIKGSGATLVSTPTSRKIVRDKRDLIVVEYGKGEGWNRPAKLRNLAFGYEIDVQSAENP
jgi:hypothetical protein